MKKKILIKKSFIKVEKCIFGHLQPLNTKTDQSLTMLAISLASCGYCTNIMTII